VPLTFFSVPKPFERDIGTIQRNAIRSWCEADGSAQVIVCGDERGCREIVDELGLDHIPDVTTNEFGTPLLSSVFARVEERARYDTLCYLNADLILFPDFLDAIGRVSEATPDDFLAVGETTNLDVGSVEDARARDALRDRARSVGAVRDREWIDFFAFTRGCLGPLPDFAVGRPYWDNWMIWRARKLKLPVIDVSPATLVIHQEHGYGHVPQAAGRRWEGPEGERNLELLGSRELAFTLDECTHRLTSAGLEPNRDRRLVHRVGTELLLHQGTLPVYRLLRGAYGRARRAITSGAPDRQV
jgi:hypothetical protein